jgi:DNA helicase-2/ATP-dependent DNA helicase PcrA
MLYVSWPKQNSRNDATQISPFLNSKAMSKYFAIRGPSFTFTVTQDLSRILRRECPGESALQRAAAQSDRTEDDLWPADGEEIPTGVNQRSSDDVSSDPSEFQPPLKRQKISTNNFSSGFDIFDKRQSVSQAVPTSKYGSNSRNAKTVQISMQSTFTSMNTSDYSAMPADTINTGFRSARKIYEEMPVMAPTMKTFSKPQQTEISKTGLDKLSKGQITLQGNITTFFSKAGSQHRNQVSMTRGHNLASTKPPIAPLQSASKSNMAERNISNTPLPLSAIPSTLVRHRPKMSPAFKPPLQHALQGDENDQHHILLPSSPTKPEDG